MKETMSIILESLIILYFKAVELILKVMNEMIKKLLGDKYSRANNIAKSVRSLQRVPEKERPRIVKKAVFNIYVIGSIIILISLWLYFLGMK